MRVPCVSYVCEHSRVWHIGDCVYLYRCVAKGVGYNIVFLYDTCNNNNMIFNSVLGNSEKNVGT